MKKGLGFDLILLGDVASGKDTQADLLVKKYDLSPVATGRQWRLMVKKNDFRGRWLQRTFGKGHPAPVAIVKWFIEKKIKSIPKNKNLIFIGGPKLKPEAQFLKKQLEIRNRNFLVFWLTLPVKEMIKRARKRMRNVDDSKYIKLRIGWYKNQQGKTKMYFQKLKKLKIINANQSINKVAADIQKAINDYQRSQRN